MAKTLHFLTYFMLILLFLSTTKSQSFSRKLSPETIGLKEEKLTHLHFYFHDTISGENITSLEVVKQNTNSSTLFGTIFVPDDPLTVGPELSSSRIGSAQGIYAATSQTELQLSMVLNFVFTEGIYNGSSLCVLGHNPILQGGVRELTIVGGTKTFRFARGFALLKTYFFDQNSGNAIVEYNMYVSHY